MRKSNLFFNTKNVLCALCSVLCIGTANASEYDTEDPLFIPALGDVLTRAGVSYSDNIAKIAGQISYGFSDRFSAGLGLHYQNDFDGDADGFSNIDLGATYRLSAGSEDSRIISDALFGIKFSGSERLRNPEFADTVYYAGMRFGRVWEGLTLAATIKTSWIFDDADGMAYIDFSPVAYFRLNPDWRLGLTADLRKATDENFDAQWVGLKLLRQYGRTQYVGHFDYEFQSREWQGGLRVNILF